jgi:GT2 family glycosyltransferase
LNKNKKVYIILLNYNGWKDTIECLESILKSDYSNYQIIVIDNDSPNNSMEYIEGKQEVLYDESSQLKHLSQPHEPKPLEYVYYTKEEALKGGDKEKESKLNNPLIFIQAGENGSFAAGNNIGMKYALAKNDFEYIWLLNNDTVIEKNSLSSLVCYASKNNLGISGSALMYYDNPDKIQAYGGTINKFFGQVSIF